MKILLYWRLFPTELGEQSPDLTLIHVGRGVHQISITLIGGTSTGMEIMNQKLDDNFFLGLVKAWIKFFYNSLSRNVRNLSLKTAGKQFFIFTSNFCKSVVGRLAQLTLDRERGVQFPCSDQFFFKLKNLFLLCGERLFSAIFKMGSIVFVAYQKVEKNAFEGLRQKNKKNKLPAPGFEPGT